MARISEVLEFMKTLIQSSVDDTLQINKGSLSEIQTCLQNAQEKIDFLQLESQLQQEELKQRSHSKHVSVQNIETATHQRKVNNVTVGSDLVPNKAAVVHADAETQSALPKLIIRPWEHLVHNKHTTGLGYEKDFPFILQTAQSPLSFRVLDSFMTVHLVTLKNVTLTTYS